MTEVSTMALLRHDNIVNFQGCHFETNTICIVMDYADVGTFSGFIQSEAERDFHSEYFGEEQIMKTIADCGNALNYLHSLEHPILHRDLKPDNILGFRGNGEIQWKLSDFGIAKLLPMNEGRFCTNTIAGTPSYMASEVNKKHNRHNIKSWPFKVWDNSSSYSFGADLWSLGCVAIYQCNHGLHLFHSPEEVKCWGAATKGHGETESSGKDASLFVKAMLTPPGRRGSLVPNWLGSSLGLGRRYAGLPESVIGKTHSPELCRLLGDLLHPEHHKRPTAAHVLQQCSLSTCTTM